MSAWVISRSDSIFKIVGNDNSKNFWLAQENNVSAIQLTNQQYLDLIYNHKCAHISVNELSFEDVSTVDLNGNPVTQNISSSEIENALKQLKRKIKEAIANNINFPQEWTTIKNYLDNINVDTLPSGQSFCWQHLCQDNSINLDGILEF